MQIINFHPDGTIDLPQNFFDDWIIDNTLSNGIDRLADPFSRIVPKRFRTSAAALTADVVGARCDWPAFSSHLVVAAREIGMDQGEVPAMLAKAWSWGLAHPSKWMDLPRRWVFDLEAGEYLEVSTGVRLSEPAFDWAFSHLCPVPGLAMSEFLLCEGPMVVIDRIIPLTSNLPRIIYRDGAE